MPKFRKRPVVVEAEQFLPSKTAPFTTPPGVNLWPDENGCQPRDMSWGYVVTAHGQRVHVQYGDWIIAEPDGRGHYPCKPDIFEATYEPAD